MPQYLLDTNIIAELGKPQPQTNLVTFLSNLRWAWLSIITLHELHYGLALLPQGRRRTRIESTMTELISQYRDYLIPIDQQEAQQAALLRASFKRQGKILHLADSLIAGTAKVHNLTLATRNTKDFDGLSVDLFNPFAEAK